MKLTNNITEKQLSKIFQESRKVEDDVSLDNLESYSEASEARLHAVETIADNNTLSAGQQLMNKLSIWTKATGHDLNRIAKTENNFNLFAWLKPGLVAASFVTTFLFLNPEMNNEIQTQQVTDKIMFNSSFENSISKQDVIIDASFDQSSNSDSISKVSFN
jgi:hypothetical protein